MRFDGADPVLTVSRAGRTLKSVPAAVRADPGYQELRRHQGRLREQARRMRTGLVERLVATAGTLAPDEPDRLRSLPAGAAMLPALLWRDRAGTIGLLDEVDTTGPVTAVHPVELHERGLLAHWQQQLVRRRLRQPVKQAFRELYLLTPAEHEAGDVSWRFAGQTVDGKVAAQLLSGRGWSTHGEYDDHQATRTVGGGLVAALACEFNGYFGMGEVRVGGLRFLAGGPSAPGRRGAAAGPDSAGSPVPLADVPPVAFSEAMRDLDLVVSVAGTVPEAYQSPAQAVGRAQLLAALVADLGLARVAVEGHTAVVRGTRATYRVQLTSGSIHVEPAGHLCVVPASFGTTAHRRLFLPFADEDRMTSIILSKVLLLSPRTSRSPTPRSSRSWPPSRLRPGPTPDLAGRLPRSVHGVSRRCRPGRGCCCGWPPSRAGGASRAGWWAPCRCDCWEASRACCGRPSGPRAGRGHVGSG